MPDTTVAKLVIAPLDSAQINLVSSSIDSLRYTIKNLGQENDSDLTALFSALIGGFLVIAGQMMVEWNKSKNERRKELILILSELVKLRWVIKNLFDQHSTAKVDCEYFEYCHKKSNDKAVKNSLRRDYLQSQGTCRKLWQNIGDTKALFLSHVTRFEKAYQKPIGINLDDLNTFHTVNCQPYDINLNIEDVRDQKVPQDVTKLRDEYLKNIEVIDGIIERLKKLQ